MYFFTIWDDLYNFREKFENKIEHVFLGGARP